MSIDLSAMDETKPDGATQSVRILDDYQRETRQNLKDWANVEHGQNGGRHKFAVGPTANRPVENLQTGSLYINTELRYLEYWDGTAWQAVDTLIQNTKSLAHSLTNKTGIALVAGDVVGLSSVDNASVILEDVAATGSPLAVALESVANNAIGQFALVGVVSVKITGAVARLRYLIKSATTLVLEDQGTSVSSTALRPDNAVAIALSSAAGPGESIITAILIGPIARTGPPPGSITFYGGSTAPAGWLLCDGAAVSRTLFPALFAAIGTTFGPGDGSTTFNLPDGRGRAVIGKAISGTFQNLNASGGNESVPLPTHTHTISHTHALNAAPAVGPLPNTGLDYSTSTGGANPATSGNPSGGGNIDTLPPYIVLNTIIKT